MPRPRRKRTWTLMIALLLFGAVLAWVATHPRVLTPWLTRLAARHLMRGVEGSIHVGAYHGNPMSSLTMTDIIIVVYGAADGVYAAGVDSLVLDYDLRELISGPVRLPAVRAVGLDLRVIQPGASDDEQGDDSKDDAPMEMRIDDLVLVDCAVTISDAHGRLLEEIPDLDWRGSLQADTELTIVSSGGAVDLATRGTIVEDPRGVATVDDEAVRFHGLTALINGRAVEASGTRTHAGDLELEVHADDMVMTEVEELIDMTLGFAAEGEMTLGLVSSDGILDLDVDFDGVLEGYELEAFRGRARLADGSLRWSSLAGRINGALFSGTGVFDVSDPDDVFMHLQGNVDDVDLSRDLVPDVVLPATDGTGWLDLRRRDSTDETWVRGWLRDGRIETVPFDSLHAEVEVDSGGVRLRVLDLLHDGQTARLSGHADPDGAFSGRLEVDVPDLSRLPPDWVLPGLHGNMRAAGEVHGMDPEFGFTGSVLVADGGVGPVTFRNLGLELSVADLLDRPAMKYRGGGRGLELGGVPLGVLTFDGGASERHLWVDDMRTEHGDTVVTVRAEAVLGDSLAVFRIPELAIDFEGSRWSLPRPAVLHTAAGRFELEETELRSSRGHLRAGVRWDRVADELEGAIDASGLDLDLVNPFIADEVLNGELTAVCELGGSTTSPSFNLRADVVDCDLPLATVDSLYVDAAFERGRLNISRLDLHSDHGRLEAAGVVDHRGAPLEDWWAGAALDLAVDVSDADWAFVDQFGIPSLDRVAGRFSGSMELGGTTSRPEIDGGLESAPFNVHWLHLDELRGRVSYRDDQLTLGDLRGNQDGLALTGRIEIPLVMDLMSEPVSPLDGPLYMSVMIPDGTDLEPLARMTNAFVEAGGTGGLDLVISGRADHPYYSGRLRIADGSCVIRKLNEVYRDISCEGVWQGDVLTLSDIRGAEGERGTLSGDGTLLFRGLVLETFDVNLDVDRFLVASVPDLRVLVKGDDLRLHGVKVGPDSLLVPRFEGDLEVIRARYTGDFSEQPGAADPMEGTVAPDWLADLEIAAPPSSAKIINSTMEIFAGGDVRLVRDEDGLNVLGGANIDKGHLPVFNNDFQVTRGTVDFSADFGVIPQLDIEAETEVRLPAFENDTRRLETIWIDVSGSAMAPQVDFRSESGFGRQNIERMLLGLSPHATETQTSSVIRTQTIAAGFNLLEREVAQSLDVVDTFDIESGREREDGTIQTLVGVGKYIGRDLYVKFAQALTDTDREVLVEYQISDHLLLQSEISRRQYEVLGNTTYSVDLKYRYEY